MISRGVHRIGIIGAGVAGLATARTLIAEGFDVAIFDRNDRLGGVWSLGYVDFGVQVQKELYEFPDFPLPPDATDFTPGPEFQRYLERYAEHFEIQSRLRLGTRVVSVTRRKGDAPGWVLRIEQNATTRDEAFDLVVVATGLYSETPYIPDYPGREQYRGEIFHAYDLATRAPLEGCDVAVIGYGKSATDIAGEAGKVGREVHLIFRDAHWPVPRKLAGVLPFKWGMLHRLTAATVHPYMRPSPVQSWLHTIGKPLVWIFWRLVELLLRVQFKLDTKIANGKTLLPVHDVEVDCFGESTMVPRPGFIDLIRQGRIKAHRTEVERFTEDGLFLKDGDEIRTDCVVFGTGWVHDYGFFGAEVREILGDDPDGFYLYRHMLHPDLSNLVFIGRASTFLSIVTYSVQARWLAEAVSGNVDLPDREGMLVEIEQLKAWKRSWMPFSTARSARILLHMANYHDELLRDFGADPFRKKGIFAPFKELLAPYQSSDYAEIVSGAWRHAD